MSSPAVVATTAVHARPPVIRRASACVSATTHPLVASLSLAAFGPFVGNDAS
jgi:hypothetical protein